jgi:hypothetical protein
MNDQPALTDILDQLARVEASLLSARSATQDSGVTLHAARRLNKAAGILAVSVLIDSAVEHYRGSFKNKAMVTPLLAGTLSLLSSVHGLRDNRPAAQKVRHGTQVAAAVTGVTGTAFHAYNVLKRPGGLTWQNLFYGAPVGAPMAILLSGLLGAAAEQVRATRPGYLPQAFGKPAGRLMAAVVALGLFGTASEAGLLHFRGAFHNPAMFAPVAAPPVAGALLLRNAVGSSRRGRWLAGLWLKVTAALGLLGVGFHAWGVQRNMGGWRNWRQTVLDGPPLPAPPSLTGLALAGLAALGLLEDHTGG